MILCDTSGLLALLDDGEAAHAQVKEALGTASGPRLTIDYVLAETDYLVLKRLGAAAERRYLEQVANGAVLREPVTPEDFRRALEIAEANADLELGVTDASVMVVALRLRCPVLTLDRRHFGAFRDERGGALTLLP